MKRKLFTNAAAFVLLTAGAVGSGHALGDTENCNNKLLNGRYGFTIQGTKFAVPNVTGPTGPQVGVAMADFYGDGTFEQIDTVTINGEVVADFTHPKANGTYTVNSDCTGTYTVQLTPFGFSSQAFFAIDSNGDELQIIVIDPGSVITCVAKKLFPGRAI